MRRILITLYRVQILAAIHLGTFGEWWAARAAHRLGKLSGESSARRGDAVSDRGRGAPHER